MKRKPTKLSDRVRQAVDASGVSRYRICKETGIDKGLMSRFMAGRGTLSMQTLDALGAVLGLDVVARGPVRVSPPAKPGPKPKPKKGTKP
jgi:transcriptional regulator with XRE-family HTH domain